MFERKIDIRTLNRFSKALNEEIMKFDKNSSMNCSKTFSLYFNHKNPEQLRKQLAVKISKLINKNTRLQ